MSDYFHVCKTVCIKVQGMFGLDFIRNIHMYVQGIPYQPGTGQIACLISLEPVSCLPFSDSCAMSNSTPQNGNTQKTK
jgi:hypothetical protein